MHSTNLGLQYVKHFQCFVMIYLIVRILLKSFTICMLYCKSLEYLTFLYYFYYFIFFFSGESPPSHGDATPPRARSRNHINHVCILYGVHGALI